MTLGKDKENQSYEHRNWEHWMGCTGLGYIEIKIRDV